MSVTYSPTVCPPRRIPFAIQEKVKLELDYMVKNKIIEPINYHTDWVNAIAVAMKKKGMCNEKQKVQ